MKNLHNKIKKFTVLLLIILIQFIFVPVQQVNAVYANPATVPLLTVSNFAALAATTVTSPLGGTVLNNGDMGTNADCTGFPSPCLSPGSATINNGVIHKADGVATIGQTDATAAVTNIGLRTSDATLLAQLGGQTLTQGVYTVPAASTNLTGNLTLSGDANSVFIFHLTSTLVTDAGSKVLLTGGAQACNVFWKVDSSATFNDTTAFVGTVFAQASVTFPGGGATLDGRVIAQTGEITFNNTTVNGTSCASATSSSSNSSSNSSSTSTFSAYCPPINSQLVSPSIIESRRIDADSIFIGWGPFSGTDKFNVRYGPANGNWLYNTDVTGFSTTINNLPANQPIWVQVTARNECMLGVYGASKLVGGPKLPDTGANPKTTNYPWQYVAGAFGLAILVWFKPRLLSKN